MSYYLADANGYLDDWGSGAQLDAFDVWAVRQGPAVAAFARNGSTPQPLILAAALSRCPPAFSPSVEAMRTYLLERCKVAIGPLYVGDGANDSAAALRSAIGNGSNQYKQKGGADKTNTSKALAKLSKLPNLSNNDTNFKAIPFEQGKDANVAALEKKEMGQHETRDYDPSTEHPLATQDYVEADKVADIVKQSTAGGTGDTSEHGAAKVANFKGRDYIVDGHHRMTAALLTGEKIKVHYYKVKK